jgi:hypothetical protein
MSCELVDNNDSLSAAMSRFSTQYDSAELPERCRGLVSGTSLVRSFRQLHLRKRILQFGQRLRCRMGVDAFFWIGPHESKMMANRR